ncbi:unnamed protein product [Peronospora belbahrii]|uniref:Uncharacterized protein n=1 Tax=Peronospora belbahrii TaxID=622444 RepID=A0ABN8D1Q4_9STRA|nr:unnamed protein product [Peronospora belbahrii]
MLHLILAKKPERPDSQPRVKTKLPIAPDPTPSDESGYKNMDVVLDAVSLAVRDTVAKETLESKISANPVDTAYWSRCQDAKNVLKLSLSAILRGVDPFLVKIVMLDNLAHVRC